MNYIDILFLVIILLSVFSGWHRGFMISMLQLSSWLATLVITYLIYPGVADFFERLIPSAGIWISLISVLFSIIILRAVFSYLINLILRSVPDNYHHRILNKISGIFPGFISGLLFILIITALLLAIPFSGSSTIPPGGVFLDKLRPKIVWLTEKASAIFDEDMIWPGGMLTVNPGSEKIIKLGFTVTNGIIREDLEAKMLILVNTERRKAGIGPLQADTALTAIARKYSAEMFAKGYFSHYTPEGKSPLDRLREARIGFLTAGENLAIAPTLSMAHQGLMNSPGHKTNILRPAFGRLGIGIIDGGRHGLMISQEFRN